MFARELNCSAKTGGGTRIWQGGGGHGSLWPPLSFGYGPGPDAAACMAALNKYEFIHNVKSE